eukprot:1158097-Prorocentrum_minimum.AAC.1
MLDPRVSNKRDAAAAPLPSSILGRSIDPRVSNEREAGGPEGVEGGPSVCTAGTLTPPGAPEGG